MTEQEIVIKAVELSIEANKKLSKKDNEIGLHDLYKDTVELTESIKPHAVLSLFPEKIFKHRSPNETKLESNYIKNNYKNITFPVFADYISTIGRPMGDGNWSIHYKEDDTQYKAADQTFQKYVEQELPEYGSLEDFIKFMLPSIKSIDANGFIAVRPAEIAYTLNEQNEKVVDSLELNKPTLFYFESKDVVDYKKGEYYLFLSKEKSVVRSYKDEKTGSIYELYTKDGVYFIEQYGLKSDNKFKAVPFYEHGLNDCQVKQLMGIPHIKDGKILYQSPFSYATDLLDLVAMNGNWEQAMINKCAFPVQVMFGSTCEFKDSHGNPCQGGILNHEGNESTCPSCHGQGLTPRISPLGTLLIAPATKFEPGEEKSTQAPLSYISPDVTTLEFIHKKVESDTIKARSILKLRNKNTSVVTNDGVMTATEVFDDAKGMYAFIKPISDQIFTIYEYCLMCIGQQRYGKEFESPELNFPKTFDFKSAEDYLNDIANATKNGLPPSFIQTILMQYINAYYGDNAKSNQIFKLVIEADRLFSLSQDEIKFQLANGTAAKWESILHSSVLNFINDSMRNDENFIEKEIKDQVLILQEMAKKIETDIKGKELDITKTLLPE